MTISLAEAVKLKSILNRKVYELTAETESVAFTVVEKDAEPKLPAHTLAQIEAELAEVRRDARKLDALIYRANIDNTITFKDEVLPIVEAIELATQLRAEAERCKQLSLSEKKNLFHSPGDTVFYRVALFEPSEYRERANNLEKEAHRLSNLINAKNYTVHIEFEDDKYF